MSGWSQMSLTLLEITSTTKLALLRHLESPKKDWYISTQRQAGNCQHPVVEMTKEEVEEQRLGDFVLMPAEMLQHLLCGGGLSVAQHWCR